MLIFFKAEQGKINRQSYLDTGYFFAVAAACLNRAVVSQMKSQLNSSVADIVALVRISPSRGYIIAS